MCGWDRCPGSERRVVTDSGKEHTLFGGTRAGVRLSAPTAIKAGVTASGLVCPPDPLGVELGAGRDVVAEARWELKMIAANPRLHRFYAGAADQIGSKELLLQHDH